MVARLVVIWAMAASTQLCEIPRVGVVGGAPGDVVSPDVDGHERDLAPMTAQEGLGGRELVALRVLAVTAGEERGGRLPARSRGPSLEGPGSTRRSGRPGHRHTPAPSGRRTRWRASLRGPGSTGSSGRSGRAGRAVAVVRTRSAPSRRSSRLGNCPAAITQLPSVEQSSVELPIVRTRETVTWVVNDPDESTVATTAPTTEQSETEVAPSDTPPPPPGCPSRTPSR